MSKIRRFASHSLLALAEAGLIAMLVVALIAGTAFAGRGSGGRASGGDLALVLVQDANANQLPNHLDDVTFTASVTGTTRPFVGLRCWQGSAFVLDGYVGLFSDALSKYATLASSYWAPADEADCTARLFHYDKRGREIQLATMDFVVAP